MFWVVCPGTDARRLCSQQLRRSVPGKKISMCIMRIVRATVDGVTKNLERRLSDYNRITTAEVDDIEIQIRRQQPFQQLGNDRFSDDVVFEYQGMFVTELQKPLIAMAVGQR